MKRAHKNLLASVSLLMVFSSSSKYLAKRNSQLQKELSGLSSLLAAENLSTTFQRSRPREKTLADLDPTAVEIWKAGK
jgi:hypothetical protein